jgi:hypothetical protein
LTTKELNWSEELLKQIRERDTEIKKRLSTNKYFKKIAISHVGDEVRFILFVQNVPGYNQPGLQSVYLEDDGTIRSNSLNLFFNMLANLTRIPVTKLLKMFAILDVDFLVHNDPQSKYNFKQKMEEIKLEEEKAVEFNLKLLKDIIDAHAEKCILWGNEVVEYLVENKIKITKTKTMYHFGCFSHMASDDDKKILEKGIKNTQEVVLGLAKEIAQQLMFSKNVCFFCILIASYFLKTNKKKKKKT